MVVLLVHMQTYQPNYPTMPAVTKGQRLWLEGSRIIAQMKRYVNEHAEL